MVEVSFLTLAFIGLGLSFILSEAALKLKYPRVIGQIFAGMILSLSIFDILHTNENMATLQYMGELGMIFLLLLTGLSLNRKKVYNARRDSIWLSLGSVAIPFFLGLGFMRLIGFEWVEAVVVGACLSLTAEGTTLEVLYDLKTLNTKLGSIIMSTGILDDIFEFFFLTAILTSVYDTVEIKFLPIRIIAFVTIVYLLFKVSPIIFKIVHKDHVKFSSFTYVILTGMFISVIAEQFHLSTLLGALIAGVLLNYTEPDHAHLRKHINQLEVVTFSVLVPFFFINIGMHFDLFSLLSNWLIAILILIIAIIGKVLGALITKPFTDLSWRQAHLVGWALNSRGMVELIIANFAYINGLISIQIFSALVAMAIITTITFPIAVKYLAKDRKIWYD